MSTLTFYTVLGIFLLANLTVGLAAGKGNGTFDDYALADRKLGLGFLTMTLIATFMSGGLIEMVKYTWHNGIYSNLTLFFHFVIPILFGKLVASQFVYYQDCMTMGDMMRKFYGWRAQVLTGLVGLFFSTVVIFGQLYGLRIFFTQFTDINPTLVVFLFGSVVLFYTVLGGLRSVVYTDVIQFVCIVITFGIITYSIVVKLKGINTLFEGFYSLEGHARLLPPIKSYRLIGFTNSVIFFSVIPTQWMMPPIVQRVLSVRSKYYISKMFWGMASTYLIIRLLIMLIGFAPIALEGFSVDPNLDKLLPSLLSFSLPNNHFIHGFVLLSLSLLMISTIDSFLHASGVIFVRDIIIPFEKEEKRGGRFDKKYVFLAQCSIVFIGFLAMFLASALQYKNWDSSALRYGSMSLFVLTSLVIPFLAGLLGLKTSNKDFFAGLIGFSGSFLFFLSLHFYFLSIGPAHTSFYGFFYSIYSLPVYSTIVQAITFFGHHLYTNQGLAMVARTANTAYHYTWRPNIKKTISLINPRQLIKSSEQAVLHLGMPTYTFSIFWCLSHMVPYVMMPAPNSWARLNGLTLTIKGISVSLCVGLLMKDWWNKKIKRYLPLYWFFTLTFCLPFSGTLLFLADRYLSIQWGFTFVVICMLLSYCLNGKLFILLSSIGIFSGYLANYILNGTRDQYNTNDFNPISFTFGLLYILILSLLLARNMDKHSLMRGEWLYDKLKKSKVREDLIREATETHPIGNVLKSVLKDMVIKTQHKGKHGYFIGEGGYQALQYSASHILDHGQQTEEAIDRLFTLIYQQVLDTHMEERSIQDLIEEAYDSLLANYKQKIMLSEEEDFYIRAPRGYFKYLLHALVQNGIEHGKASQISIKLNAKTRTLELQDNGKGIPTNQLAHIFDLLYSESTTHALGLGLVLAKMVVKTLNGTISCESKQGAGSYTKFLISFPNLTKK